MVPGEQRSGRTIVYGPEPWRTRAGVVWSYWDLWLCVLCVAHHGGDWDALDAAMPAGYESERMWSQLLDVRQRLGEANLTAASLVGPMAQDTAVRAKARAKVMRSQAMYSRDLTPAMKNPPSAAQRRRALFGSWPSFPHSPRESYDRLAAPFEEKDDRFRTTRWNISEMARDITEAEQELVERAGKDVPKLLAVRRAALTLHYQIGEAFPDSAGALVEAAQRTYLAYTDIDWSATGMDAEVFWEDLLRWVVFAGNHGLVDRSEAVGLRRAGIERHLELVEAILANLAADYAAARLDWHAKEVLRILATAAVVATGPDGRN